jgi:hypothetical protein
VEKRPFEGAWVLRVLGLARGLIVAELFQEELGADPWLELVVLDPHSPARPLARLEVSGTDPTWEGDADLWARLPRLHYRLVGSHPPGQEILTFLEEEPGRVRIIDVASIGGRGDVERPLRATLAPDGRTAIFGREYVGRELVLYDLQEDRVTGVIELSRSLSAVPLRFRPSTWELWFACRNRVVRADIASGRLVGELEVGHWEDDVADMAFDRTFSTCAVALHRSGSVITVDTDAFTVTHRAWTGESLHQIVQLEDGRFVAKAFGADRFIVGDLLAEPFSLPESRKD